MNEKNNNKNNSNTSNADSKLVVSEKVVNIYTEIIIWFLGLGVLTICLLYPFLRDESSIKIGCVFFYGAITVFVVAMIHSVCAAFMGAIKDLRNSGGEKAFDELKKALEEREEDNF